MKIIPLMSAKEKKELIKKRLADGDKRTYNQIKADLELELWRERFALHLPNKI